MSERKTHDSDRIEDLDGRIHRIPGLVERILEQAGSYFPNRPTLTTDSATFWLNCTSDEATPSAVTPVVHHMGCDGKFRLVVRHEDIPVNKPGAAVALQVSDRTGRDRTIVVTSSQLVALQDLHDDFVPGGRRR